MSAVHLFVTLVGSPLMHTHAYAFSKHEKSVKTENVILQKSSSHPVYFSALVVSLHYGTLGLALVHTAQHRETGRHWSVCC